MVQPACRKTTLGVEQRLVSSLPLNTVTLALMKINTTLDMISRGEAMVLVSIETSSVSRPHLLGCDHDIQREHGLAISLSPILRKSEYEADFNTGSYCSGSRLDASALNLLKASSTVFLGKSGTLPSSSFRREKANFGGIDARPCHISEGR